MSNKDTAVIVDFLCNFGGIEKEVVTIAKNMDVDIIAGIYSPEKTFPELKGFNVRCILNKKLPSGINSLYLRRKFRKMKLNQYKNFIILGTNSMAIARNNHKSIWICNSPALYLYGFDCEKDFIKKESEKIKNPVKRVIYRNYLKFMRKIDQKDYKHIDVILANSQNVLERVKRAYPYEKEIKIVNPPTDIKKFKYIKTGDFYLSGARLNPGKNVDKIVEAFTKMPDKKLIVVSDGPQRKEIEEKARDSKNIEINGPVSEEELRKLYGECIAAITVTKAEDFGMIAIESMSSGKPVIVTNKGGFKETVIKDKTGVFIEEATPENIIEAVKKMTNKKAKSMRKDCEKRAKKFSDKKFIEGIRENMQ